MRVAIPCARERGAPRKAKAILPHGAPADGEAKPPRREAGADATTETVFASSAMQMRAKNQFR